MITPDGRRNKHKRGESDTITPTRQRQKHRSGDKLPELASLKLPAKSPSHNKELINAANLDKPLSVDVGEDTDPFSEYRWLMLSWYRLVWIYFWNINSFGGNLKNSDRNSMHRK